MFITENIAIVKRATQRYKTESLLFPHKRRPVNVLIHLLPDFSLSQCIYPHISGLFNTSGFKWHIPVCMTEAGSMLTQPICWAQPDGIPPLPLTVRCGHVAAGTGPVLGGGGAVARQPQRKKCKGPQYACALSPSKATNQRKQVLRPGVQRPEARSVVLTEHPPSSRKKGRKNGDAVLPAAHPCAFFSWLWDCCRCRPHYRLCPWVSPLAD